jgi:hypothetical protein
MNGIRDLSDLEVEAKAFKRKNCRKCRKEIQIGPLTPYASS